MASEASAPSTKPWPYRLAPRDDDLAPLADLWVASWQAVLPEIDFPARRDWFCTYLQEMESCGGSTLCAYDSRAGLAGFVLLDIGKCVLEQLAVSPSLFGSGLGAWLLDEAKSRCPGGLSLDVNADNPRALRFYEKHGFVRQSPGTNPLSGLATWRMIWRPVR